MGKYYVATKYKKLMALIRILTTKYGFIFKHGTKHHKVTAPSGKSAVIPHKHGQNVSAGVVESFCKFIKAEGIKPKLIDEYIF